MQGLGNDVDLGTPFPSVCTPMRTLVSPIGIPPLKRDSVSYVGADYNEAAGPPFAQEVVVTPQQKIRISLDQNTKESLCPNFMRLSETRDSTLEAQPPALPTKDPFSLQKSESSKSVTESLFVFVPEQTATAAAVAAAVTSKPMLSPMSDLKAPPSSCSSAASGKKKTSKHKQKPTAIVETEESEEESKLGRKKTYTAEEDRLLLQLVRRYGEKNWSKIAELMPGRNRKQLRDHYVNFLKKTVSHREFTAEEDEIIFSVVKQHGHAWKRIADLLPGRTPIMIKNRYNSQLRRGKGKESESGSGSATSRQQSGEEVSAEQTSPVALATRLVKMAKTIDKVRANIQKLHIGK